MIYINEIEQLIISGQNGLITSYNTTQKSQIHTIGLFQMEVQYISGLFLSIDYQYLFVGAYYDGMCILKLNLSLDSKNNLHNQITFNQVGTGVVGFSAQFCLATKDFYVYCYDQWTGLYYANTQQLAQKNQNENTYPINFQFVYYWPDQQPNPSIKSLLTNSQETILFVGVRSLGVYLFDIMHRNQIQLIQVISTDSIPFSIQLSRNENYLYVTNTSSVFAFPQIQTNLNDNFPNLFNTHQSAFNDLKLAIKPRCYTDFSDNYLFGAFDQDGFFVFPIFKNPYRLNTKIFKNYPFQLDTLQFEQEGKYIIVPEYYQGIILSIYQYNPLNNSEQQQDISPMNMKIVKVYNYDTNFYSAYMAFSLDRSIAVQSVQEFLIIYNSTNILDMQILSIWQKPNPFIGDLSDVCISPNNKWIIGIILDQGYYVLDISNKTNPTLVNYQVSLSGSSILLSTYYNLAYVAEGGKGFGILDLTFLPQIKYMSRLSITGYSYMLLPLQKEDFIIITQSDKGLITLVDITNKQNPIIINKILYLNQHAQAVCSCKTLNYLFIAISNGILTVPFKSDFQIHTEVAQIKQFINPKSTQKLRYNRQSLTLASNQANITNEYIFQVGQTIVLDFTILYPINLDMTISNIYIYQSGKIENLPTYFMFDVEQSSLQILIQKDLLGLKNIISDLIIILIKTQIPIDSISFIYQSQDSADLGITNSTQATLIYQYLINQNIINLDGTINDNYDVQKQLTFDNQFQNLLIDKSVMQESLYLDVMSQIIQKVSITLKKSYSYNPFKFYVISSLNFDNQNKFKYISTNSLDTITVTLQINSKIGKLIHKKQDSINFQISDSQDQLQIQGTLENVNKVLQQQIIFANSSQINEISSSTIQITVNDNINLPLTKLFNISECTFIVLKKQIAVNKHLNLQSQINQQFVNAVVDIETNIAITFSSKTFIVGDTSLITYQAYIQGSDGEFIIIPPSLWLQQQSNDKLNFRGTTTSSLYGQIYRFQIKATDGYTTAVDQFTVQVYGIPFTYALNLLIKILGPLIGILGIFKARYHFFNIIFSERVTFSQEEVECGIKYNKQLIIINKQYEDGMYIVRNLFKNIMQKDVLLQQNKQSGIKKNNNISDIQLKNMDNLFETNIKTNQLGENYFKDYQKFEQTKKLTIEKEANQQYIQKVLLNLSKFKNKCSKSDLEKRYLNESGGLVLSKVIQDIISFNIRPDTYSQISEQQFINELVDENSLIQRIIRALISRYLLKLDKISQIIYEFIKLQCFNIIQHNKNDWYKAIINIQYRNYPLQNEDQEDQNIFPLLHFKYEQLLQILQQLNNNNDHKLLQKIPNSFSQLKKYFDKYLNGVNIFLLREVIFADAYGFPQYKPSSFQPSIGLSIHINSQDISQIIAFKKRNINKYIKPIFKLLNLEYTRYAFSKNTRLPTWLSFNLKKGVIFLYGVPQNQDIEEVLIKIYNDNKYVIQQFIINVSLNESQLNKKIKQYDQINNQLDQSKLLLSQNEQRLPKRPKMRRNIYSSSHIKDSEMLQSHFTSQKNLTDIMKNSFKLEYPIKTNQNQTLQNENLQLMSESNNIGDELKEQELKSFLLFSPHQNSLSSKESQTSNIYINVIAKDEVKENI